MSGHYFKSLRGRRDDHNLAIRADREELVRLLSIAVVDPFARMTEDRVSATVIPLKSVADDDEPTANPGHPACAEYAGSDYCRESWEFHLAELAHRPHSHWHQCDYDRLCAIVPVVYRRCCFAAVKVACAASMAEEDFEHCVEILDSLVRGFVVAQADFLNRMLRSEPAGTETDEALDRDGVDAGEPRPDHPQVQRAIQYIKEHLSDPKLSVGRIARELGIHPNYLSQIFADQAGQRMRQYIAARRVDLAKTLLTDTDYQIKRIAHETGHANHNWFCYVFRMCTGLTPGAYRRSSSGGSGSAPA